MPRTPMMAVAVLALALAAVPLARAAAPDGNVEWNGLSHSAAQDRRPLCPVLKESFQVRVQAYRNDLTAMRVHWTDGATSAWIDGARIGSRGPYDVWAAQLPASTTNTPSYWFQVIDGTDSTYVSVSGTSHTVPADGGYALDFATYAHAPLGATPATGGVAFKVWAPTPSLCSVRGEFNGWGVGTYLTKVGETFSGYIPGAVAGQQYKYWFNNVTWNSDARARALNPGSSYNAYVINPLSYVWHDSAYATPALAHLVVYQLHVGTFAGYNDPRGSTTFPSKYLDVAARASYLDSLGVNAVMFNPFTEFPTDISAGYNPVSMWAPESYYGTPDNCRAMVDSLHAHGIAALLDIVWNHFSPTDNYLWNYDGYQEYFATPDIGTPWGSQANFARAGVQDYYANSAWSWLEEYHLDGFRMDATSAMTAYQGSLGSTLMQRLNNEKNQRWADKLTIAEQLPSLATATTPTASGGYGFDTQYNMTFRDNVRGAIFAAASGDPSMSSIRTALIGTPPYLSGVHVFDYIELHDEAWPSSGGSRMVKSIDTTAPYDDVYAKGRTKLGFGLTLTAPGVPALLMGTEWLESIDFGPDSQYRIDWSKRAKYPGIWAFYRDLIHLRRSLDPLGADASIYVSHVNESGNVIAFRRFDAAGNSIMVLANFSNTDYTNYRIGVPSAGTWLEALDSQSTKYEGSGPDNPGVLVPDAIGYDGYSQSLALNLPRMALVVLGQQSLLGVGDAPVAPALRFGRVGPVPTHGGVTVAFSLPRAGRARLAVLDVSGRSVATLVDGALGAGEHRVTWDGRDGRGARVGAGVYFLALESDGARVAKRVPVLR